MIASCTLLARGCRTMHTITFAVVVTNRLCVDVSCSRRNAGILDKFYHRRDVRTAIYWLALSGVDYTEYEAELPPLLHMDGGHGARGEDMRTTGLAINPIESGSVNIGRVTRGRLTTQHVRQAPPQLVIRPSSQNHQLEGTSPALRFTHIAVLQHPRAFLYNVHSHPADPV